MREVIKVECVIKKFERRVFSDAAAWYELLLDEYQDTIAYNCKDDSPNDISAAKESLWRYSCYLATHCIEYRDSVKLVERVESFESDEYYSDFISIINNYIKLGLETIRKCLIEGDVSFTDNKFLNKLYKFSFGEKPFRNKDAEFGNSLSDVLLSLSDARNIHDLSGDVDVNLESIVRGFISLLDRKLLHRSLPIFGKDVLYMVRYLVTDDWCFRYAYDVCELMVKVFTAKSEKELVKYYNKLNSNLDSILEEQIVNVLQLVFGSTRGISIAEVIMTYLRGTEIPEACPHVTYVPSSPAACELYMMSNEPDDLLRNSNLSLNTYMNEANINSMYGVMLDYEDDLIYQIFSDMLAVTSTLPVSDKAGEICSSGLLDIRQMMLSGELLNLMGVC